VSDQEQAIEEHTGARMAPNTGGLRDLQERFRELGRLRMGRKSSSQGGHPVKLDTWRLTSPGRGKWLLEAAAKIYGGQVQPWDGAPTDGEHWELITETDSLPIIIPPGIVLSQAYELWTADGCKKRCDGVRQMLRDVACSCPKEHAERMKEAAKGKACSPVTRLSVILPDLPDLGVWRLESHGYHAAVELAGVTSLVQVATTKGMLIPARLRIDKRRVKRAGEKPRQFTVPVIEAGVSFEHFAHALELPQAVMEEVPPAISPPPVERKALPGHAPPVSTDEDAPEAQPRVEASGSVEHASMPGAAPATAAATVLPQTILDLPGTDGDIIDMANTILREDRQDRVIESLEDLTGAPEEFLERLTQRLREVEPSEDPGEQGSLIS
jgi:hypothetical protein